MRAWLALVALLLLGLLPANAAADPVSLQVAYDGQPSAYEITQKYTDRTHDCSSDTVSNGALIWDSSFVGSLPDKPPALTTIPGAITSGFGTYGYAEQVRAWDDSGMT